MFFTLSSIVNLHHADRNSASLVCKSRYDRRHVFIGNCYAVSPPILTRRFTDVRSITIKGKHFLAAETPHEDKMEDVSYELELEKLFSVESENELFGESKRSSEEAKTLHPLEGYLFASSYELSADTSPSVHVEKQKDDSILIRKYKAAAHHMRRILQPCHKRNAVVRD